MVTTMRHRKELVIGRIADRIHQNAVELHRADYRQFASRLDTATRARAIITDLKDRLTQVRLARQRSMLILQMS